jgi:hypothetical protein
MPEWDFERKMAASSWSRDEASGNQLCNHLGFGARTRNRKALEAVTFQGFIVRGVVDTICNWAISRVGSANGSFL